MARVFLGVGHGGQDSGAVGYLVEKDVNLNMAMACRDYLVANGVEVKMSRYSDEDDSLNEEARECNAYRPDLAIDIHNNSGGGDGFEAFCSIYGGLGRTLAQNIEKEVVAIGQNSRGVKTREGKNGDYYGFIRMTTCPAVIVEGVFVDTEADAAQADTLEEQEAFGVAYARGILATLGIESSNQPEPETPQENYEDKNTDIYHDGIINCVYDIQEYLNRLYNTNLELDDKNGPKTKAGMVLGLQVELNKQFQAGIAEDGDFGPETKGACVNVKRNASGRITYLIQMALFLKGYTVNINGKFDNATAKAVKAFQLNSGLEVDEIVGKNTFEALLK